MRIMFNAPKYAQILNETSSSKAMFTIVRTILENVEGKNVVTTELEHPSVYDSVRYYANKRGMEVRVCAPDKQTGSIIPEEIAAMVDEDTALVTCMYASNHTGAVMDMKKIVELCRAKKTGRVHCERCRTAYATRLGGCSGSRAGCRKFCCL